MSSFPQQQGIGFGQGVVVFVQFFRFEDQVPDLAADQGFRLTCQPHQVFLVDVVPHEHQVDDRRVDATGKIPGHVYLLHIAQLGHHPVDNLVETDVLQQDVMDIAEQGMLRVGTENLLVALHLGGKQARLFKLVQLKPYGVGAFAKLTLQVSQIGPGVRVQEELQEELDTGLAGN